MINSLKVKDSKITKEEVFIFLSTWLKKEIEASQRMTMNDDVFEKPSWSEYQAHQLGFQKAYSKVLNLIPTKD